MSRIRMAALAVAALVERGSASVLGYRNDMLAVEAGIDTERIGEDDMPEVRAQACAMVARSLTRGSW